MFGIETFFGIIGSFLGYGRDFIDIAKSIIEAVGVSKSAYDDNELNAAWHEVGYKYGLLLFDILTDLFSGHLEDCLNVKSSIKRTGKDQALIDLTKILTENGQISEEIKMSLREWSSKNINCFEDIWNLLQIGE